MLLKSEIYLRQIADALRNLGDCPGNLKQRSVLVTGAAGMLGSCVTDMLIYLNEKQDLQIEIYAMGRTGRKLYERFGDYCGRHYFHVAESDLSREQKLKVPADYVIHAASNADPYMFANAPVDTLLANVIGVKNVLDLAGNHHAKRVLYVSSGEMYGQPDEAVADGFREDDCGAVNYGEARSCYPAGKRAAEALCQSYIQQYGLDVVIVRPCHCYGPTMTATDSRALSQFFRNVLNGEDIVLKSSGETVRSHCYAIDAAAAMLKVLVDGKCGEAYNIADAASVVSIREAAKLIAEAGGQALRFELPDETDRRGFSKVTRAVLIAEKLRAMGWSPLFDMQKGVVETLKILSAGQKG